MIKGQHISAKFECRNGYLGLALRTGSVNNILCKVYHMLASGTVDMTVYEVQKRATLSLLRGVLHRVEFCKNVIFNGNGMLTSILPRVATIASIIQDLVGFM